MTLGPIEFDNSKATFTRTLEISGADNVTPCIISDTGALTVRGGGSVYGNFNIGGSFCVQGDVILEGLTANGPVSFNGEVTFTDTLVLSGDQVGIFEVGMIMLWSGSVGTIPDKWALCDGTNGTPNLQDRFVVGAGDTYNPDDTGGANTETLTVANLPVHSHPITGSLGSAGSHSHAGSSAASGGSHRHTYTFGTTTRDGGGGPQVRTVSGSNTAQTQSGGSSHSHSLNITPDGSHTHSTGSLAAGNTGSGTAHNNMPLYYALAYIMYTG